MQRMKADAGLSSFLRDRADAVEAALEGDPRLGRNCPSFDVTGISRNETETVFCRAWRVTSEMPANWWVTVTGGAPHRRALGRDERLVLRDASRRVLRSAFGRIGGPAEAVKRRGCLGAASAGCAHRAAHGARHDFDGGAGTRRDDAAT